MEMIGTLGIDAPPWLDFGRLLVADLVTRRRGELADDPDDGVALIEGLRSVLFDSLDDDAPFTMLVAHAALRPIDVEVLALALAVEIDPTLARLLGHANGVDTASRLTISNVAELLDASTPDDGASARSALLPTSPLMRCGYLELATHGLSLFGEQRIEVHETVAWAVGGDWFADPDLPIAAELIDVDRDGTVDTEPIGTLLVVSGAGRIERRRATIAHSSRSRFLATAAPNGDPGWAALVRTATIAGRVIILETDSALPDEARRWINRSLHLDWAVTSPGDLPVDQLPSRPHHNLSITGHEPTDAEWASVLGVDAPRTHRLSVDQLDTVGKVMPSVGNDVDAAVRRLVGGEMDNLAQRIRPERGWDDIVLSPERTTLLRSIVDRYRYADTVYDRWGFDARPSRGLVAAFAGPSGTGKTLASEVIAGELGLDVFKLDLSSVVSKYIGETEKNLERIFEAASAGNMVLFFDEADALFGKRSEVSDARDRYANIEVSYLLQRLERYDGLVIMATNFEKNIDEAFMRRIHVRIEFAIPEAPERQAIWERNLPTTAPLEGVDCGELAERFELAGGSIRNAAVHAAFLAASDEAPITMERAVLGVAREFRKMGRLIKPATFGDYFSLVAPHLDAESTDPA